MLSLSDRGVNIISRIWTHNLRGAEYIEDFKPTACPTKGTLNAVRISAGDVGMDAQLQAASNGHAVVMGSDHVSSLALQYFPYDQSDRSPLNRTLVLSGGSPAEDTATSRLPTEWAPITFWKPLL